MVGYKLKTIEAGKGSDNRMEEMSTKSRLERKKKYIYICIYIYIYHS